MREHPRRRPRRTPSSSPIKPGCHYLQSLPGRDKPALVLRTDVANVYGGKLPRALFSRMIEQPVEQALRLDAACVVVNLFRIPDQPEVTDQCLQNILKIKPECDRMGMPLMIEPLVFQANQKAGGYMVDGDLEKILPLVRQAVELGADIIKADPTDDVGVYNQVVQNRRAHPGATRARRQQGAGRGKFSNARRNSSSKARRASSMAATSSSTPDPAGITRALMAIVHEWRHGKGGGEVDQRKIVLTGKARRSLTAKGRSSSSENRTALRATTWSRLRGARPSRSPRSTSRRLPRP